MIDWLTISIDFRHRPLAAGTIVSVDQNGEVEWQSPKGVTARGSFDSATRVRSRGALDSDGHAAVLQLDGNPAKFLQGHNVFGTDDVNLLVVRWFMRVCDELGLIYTPFDLYRISKGVYQVARVDINYMFRLGTCYDVQAFLDALGETARTKYRRAIHDRGSVYFNKGSRRWSSVVYNKLAETKVRRKGQRIELEKDIINRLRTEIQNCIRWEIKLLSMELKENGIYTGTDLADFGARNLFKKYLAKLKIDGNMKMTDQKAAEMPRRLRGTYELWKAGFDVREFLSDRTFYRHSKDLHQKYGIDLYTCPRQPGSNIVSLSRVLEPEPVPVPAWVRNMDQRQYLRAV